MFHRPPERGEVWIGYTPGLPDDPHQPRPLLIVSHDLRNRNRPHVLAIPIFSRGRVGPTRVMLPEGAGGLSHASVLFCEEVMTVHHQFLADGPLGDKLSGAIMDQVVRAVRRAVGEIVPEPSPSGWTPRQ